MESDDFAQSSTCQSHTGVLTHLWLLVSAISTWIVTRAFNIASLADGTEVRFFFPPFLFLPLLPRCTNGL